MPDKEDRSGENYLGELAQQYELQREEIKAAITRGAHRRVLAGPPPLPAEIVTALAEGWGRRLGARSLSKQTPCKYIKTVDGKTDPDSWDDGEAMPADAIVLSRTLSALRGNQAANIVEMWIFRAEGRDRKGAPPGGDRR